MNPRNTKRFIASAIATLICLGVGLTARYFQAGSIDTWYPALAKPSLTPPDIAFPVAWGLIYLLMGISIGIIWDRPPRLRTPLARIFAVQLVLNFMWSISFFYFRCPLAGFINIVALDIAVLWYACKVRHVSRLSAWLIIPYLLWLAFATYLNAYIRIYN